MKNLDKTVGEEEVYWPPEKKLGPSTKFVPISRLAWEPPLPKLPEATSAVGVHDTRYLFEEMVENGQEDKVLYCTANAVVRLQTWWEALYLPPLLKLDPESVMDNIQLWIIDRSKSLPSLEERHKVAEVLTDMASESEDILLKFAVSGFRNWMATLNAYERQNAEGFVLYSSMTIMWAYRFAKEAFSQTEPAFYRSLWYSCV